MPPPSALAGRTRTPVPHSKAVRDLLTDLLGRDVDVAPGDPVVPRLRDPATVGVYTTERLQTRALVVLSLPLAAAVGAALALVPAAAVAEAVEAGALPESLAENTDEVLNVAAGLFTRGDAPRLTRYQVVPAGTLPPPDVAVLCRTLGRRLDLRVEVSGYGRGGLSVVVAG